MTRFIAPVSVLVLVAAVVAGCASRDRSRSSGIGTRGTSAAVQTGPTLSTLGTRGRGLTPGTTHGTGSVAGAGISITTVLGPGDTGAPASGSGSGGTGSGSGAGTR